VTQRFVAPPGFMILGAPAKVVRPLTGRMQGLRPWAEKYVEVAKAHAARLKSHTPNAKLQDPNWWGRWSCAPGALAIENSWRWIGIWNFYGPLSFSV
jgi:hypothetical protein